MRRARGSLSLVARLWPSLWSSLVPAFRSSVWRAALVGWLIGAGCDWRPFDDLAKQAPVVSAGAPSGFGPSADFGQVLLPIAAPSDVATVAARYLVSGVTATGLALIELDAGGNPQAHNITSPALDDLAGSPIVSLAEIPGVTNGAVLMGSPQLDGLSGGAALVLSLTADLTVQRLTVAEDLNAGFGIGVAAGNLVGAAATADYVVLTDSALLVYPDGSTTAAALSYASAPACPIALAAALPAEDRQSRAVTVGSWGAASQIAVGTPNVTGAAGSVSIFNVDAAGVHCAFTLTGTDSRFGQSLAVGDFDGDKNMDLLVGAPPEHAYVYFGPLSAATVGVPLGGPPGGVAFGAAVAAVNLDGVGGDEAVVGDSDATVDGQALAGQVVTFTSGKKPVMATQVSDRYPTANEGYGAAVAALRFCPPPAGCAATDIRRLLLVGAVADTFTLFRLGAADVDPRTP
jgi:hypothetical protein